MLAQHQPSIGSTSRVCWADTQTIRAMMGSGGKCWANNPMCCANITPSFVEIRHPKLFIMQQARDVVVFKLVGVVNVNEFVKNMGSTSLVRRLWINIVLWFLRFSTVYDAGSISEHACAFGILRNLHVYVIISLQFCLQYHHTDQCQCNVGTQSAMLTQH